MGVLGAIPSIKLITCKDLVDSGIGDQLLKQAGVVPDNGHDQGVTGGQAHVAPRNSRHPDERKGQLAAEEWIGPVQQKHCRAQEGQAVALHAQRQAGNLLSHISRASRHCALDLSCDFLRACPVTKRVAGCFFATKWCYH